VSQLDVDPDPAPITSPWQEYLAAAQSLDAVRRELAGAVAAAAEPVIATRAELAQLGQRLEQQRAQLTGLAVRAGLPAPQLAPGPPEQAVAGPDTDPPQATLPRCRQLLDRGDAELSAAARAGRASRPRSRLLVAVLAGAVVVLACVLVMACVLVVMAVLG
jgi:hypothetical protein